ncbi:MAG: prepilin-type N-terminal cleavage/methylation domain-containing protein [Planctomycetota bacterium]
MIFSKGMALIEVIIAAAIIAIFLGSVCSVLGNFLFSSATGQNYLTASHEHQKAMDIMIEELIQTSCNATDPKFRILAEGRKISFKKFVSLSLVDDTSVSTYSSDIEFYRDNETGYVIRAQDGRTQIIGQFCTELKFTLLPARRISITMTNKVGNPNNSYVGLYTNTIEITPRNID